MRRPNNHHPRAFKRGKRGLTHVHTRYGRGVCVLMLLIDSMCSGTARAKFNPPPPAAAAAASPKGNATVCAYMAVHNNLSLTNRFPLFHRRQRSHWCRHDVVPHGRQQFLTTINPEGNWWIFVSYIKSHHSINTIDYKFINNDCVIYSNIYLYIALHTISRWS